MGEQNLECTRLLLLLAHEAGTIDDEEFLLLNFCLDEEDLKRLGKKKIRRLPPAPSTPRPNLRNLSEEDCVEMFRFLYEEIEVLAVALDLPEMMTATNGLRWSRVEGLCILLRRLAYPCRLSDLVHIFGRGVSDISRIANSVCLFIANRWRHLLLDFTAAPHFSPERLHSYAEAVQAKCPLKNCIGFVDGTVRPMCRPIIEQKAFYNGKDRVHCIKFQSIVTPDGLIAHLYGPMEGRRHDAAMLRESSLLHQLENNLPLPEAGDCYCLYGDAAYPLRPQLITPFKGAHLTPEQRAFNGAMSSVRMCVEWGFQKVRMLFAFLDFEQNLKILLQPIAAYYITGAVLANCHTCMHQSQTSLYFGVQAPTLLEYLQ